MKIVFTVFGKQVARIDFESELDNEQEKVLDTAVKATSRWWTKRMTN